MMGERLHPPWEGQSLNSKSPESNGGRLRYAVRLVQLLQGPQGQDKGDGSEDSKGREGSIQGPQLAAWRSRVPLWGLRTVGFCDICSTVDSQTYCWSLMLPYFPPLSFKWLYRSCCISFAIEQKAVKQFLCRKLQFLPLDSHSIWLETPFPPKPAFPEATLMAWALIGLVISYRFKILSFYFYCLLQSKTVWKCIQSWCHNVATQCTSHGVVGCPC